MAKNNDKDKESKSKPKKAESKPKKSTKKAKSKSNKDEHVVKGAQSSDRIVQTNPSSGIAKYVLTGLIIVALAVVAVFALSSLGLITVNDEATQQNQEFEGEVAATVGNEEIYVEQLETRQALFRVTTNPMITQQQVLEFLIEEEVLRQEADRLGIEVSEEALTQAEQQLLTGSGLSREEISLQLSQQGASYDELIAYYSAGIRSTELVEQEVFSDIEDPTTEEAMAFYEENQEQFITPNSADVRQIILAQNQGQNRSEEAQDIINRIEDGEDFCELVAEFSDDPTANETCGEQSYTANSLVDPQVVDTAFALETGEVEAVTTPQGIFIFEKLGETEQQQQSFDEVEQLILEQLENQRLQEAYRQYVDDLLEEYGFEIVVELEEQQQQVPFEIQ